MVDTKTVAVVAGLGALGLAALAMRGEGEPAGEGAPEGFVSLEVSKLGRSGSGFDAVQGAWGVGATVNVNGVVTAGFPVPSMVLELYDNGVLRKTETPVSVVLGTSYTLTDTMGVADVGGHTVYGRMVLTNALGSFEFTSASQSFDVGEEPPGDVTIDVTLT